MGEYGGFSRWPIMFGTVGIGHKRRQRERDRTSGDQVLWEADVTQAGAEQCNPFSKLEKVSFITRQFPRAVLRVRGDTEAAGKSYWRHRVPYSTGALKLKPNFVHLGAASEEREPIV
jgi:hypothetical protein